MKRILIVLSMLLLVGGIAYGNPNVFSGPSGTAFSGRGPHGGQGFGPPPEAFTACEGKTDGDQSQFVNPEGRTVTGTCRTTGNRLVLRPDHPRRNSRNGRQGPPPEAYTACEGKSAGDAAQLTGPRGETVSGTCEEMNGKLVLRPERRNGNRPGPEER